MDVVDLYIHKNNILVAEKTQINTKHIIFDAIIN